MKSGYYGKSAGLDVFLRATNELLKFIYKSALQICMLGCYNMWTTDTGKLHGFDVVLIISLSYSSCQSAPKYLVTRYCYFKGADYINMVGDFYGWNCLGTSIGEHCN
jgi:hypothetical protein